MAAGKTRLSTNFDVNSRIGYIDMTPTYFAYAKKIRFVSVNIAAQTLFQALSALKRSKVVCCVESRVRQLISYIFQSILRVNTTITIFPVTNPVWREPSQILRQTKNCNYGNCPFRCSYRKIKIDTAAKPESLITRVLNLPTRVNRIKSGSRTVFDFVIVVG